MLNNPQDAGFTVTPFVISCIKGEREKSYTNTIKELMLCNIYIYPIKCLVQYIGEAVVKEVWMFSIGRIKYLNYYGCVYICKTEVLDLAGNARTPMVYLAYGSMKVKYQRCGRYGVHMISNYIPQILWDIITWDIITCIEVLICKQHVWKWSTLISINVSHK